MENKKSAADEINCGEREENKNNEVEFIRSVMWQGQLM